MKILVYLILLCLFNLSLASCGQSGTLYLPNKDLKQEKKKRFYE